MNKISAVKGLSITLIVLTSLVLYGCTVPTYVFIKNISDVPKQIVLTSRNLSRDTFRYTNENIPLSIQLSKEMPNVLPINNVNDSVLSIAIPPKATVLIEKSYNYVSAKFSSVTIEGDEILRDGFKYTSYDSEVRKQQGLALLVCYEIK